MHDYFHLFTEWLRIGEHKMELIFGIFCATLAGLIKYASGIFLLNIEVIGRILEAGVVALVSGFLGGLGVHLWNIVKKKFLQKKSK